MIINKILGAGLKAVNDALKEKDVDLTGMVVDKSIDTVKQLYLVSKIIASLKSGYYPPPDIDKDADGNVTQYTLITKSEFDNIMYNLLMFTLKKGMERNEKLGFNTFDISEEARKVLNEISSLDTDEISKRTILDDELLSEAEFIKKIKESDAESCFNKFKRDSQEEIKAFISIASFLETTYLLTKTIHEMIYMRMKNKITAHSYHKYVKYNTVSLENVLATAFKYMFFAYPYTNTATNDAKYVSSVVNRHSKFKELLKNKKESETTDLPIINQDYIYEEMENELHTYYIEGNEAALTELKKLYDEFVRAGNKYISLIKNIYEIAEENHKIYKILIDSMEIIDRAYNYLNKDLAQDWALINEANIDDGSKRASHSLLIISKKGIFRLELKKYDCETIRITSDGKVIKESEDRSTYDDVNLIKESESNLRFIRRFMEEEGGLSDKECADLIHGAVIVMNKDMDIVNETDYPILRLGQLKNYLNNKCPDLFTDEELNKIKALIKENEITDRKNKYKFYDTSIVKSEELKIIQNNDDEFIRKYSTILGDLDRIMNLTQSISLVPSINYYGNNEYKQISDDTKVLLANINVMNHEFVKSILEL